ncbi:MAG TPA: cytochrome-c peroxidase, partial [Pseudomonadales bacterium]|nr:cytochrome-c peroxidase [Pseudomonadales bacterium]
MRAVGMLRITCLLGAAIILSACGGGGGSSGNSGDAGHASPALSQTARLGKLMFEDTALSASGKQSCGTCHKATSGFTDPDQTPVSKGGPDMTLTGLRNAPTLFYANAVPSFHFEADGTPVGGQFRDGRVNSLAEQAALPFTNSFEMANSSAEEVVDRLKTRPYLNEFTALYGADVLADADQTLRLMANAIATYENEDEEFHS